MVREGERQKEKKKKKRKKEGKIKGEEKKRQEMVGPIYIGLIIIHDNRNITTMMINNNKTVNR